MYAVVNVCSQFVSSVSVWGLEGSNSAYQGSQANWFCESCGLERTPPLFFFTEPVKDPLSAGSFHLSETH